MLKDRKEDLEDRSHFIGGSDARVIMGGDENALIRLWQQKRGEAEPVDLSGNLIVQLGLVTEGLNRFWFERMSGHRVGQCHQKKFKKEKHVTGPELLQGIKQVLMQKFGPLARTVLNHWGIKQTDDFGNIVFNLVEFRILSKNEQDHYDSFKNAYDFEVVFDQGYRTQLARRLKTMRF